MEDYTPNGSAPVRRTRKKQKPWWQALLSATPLLLCMVLIGLVYLLTGCFGLNQNKTNGDASAPVVTPSEPVMSDVPADTATPTELAVPTTAPDISDVPPSDSTEPAETEAVSTEPPTTEPAPTEPAEKTFTSVESDYFDDALFIGDSRTNGLEIYDPPSDKADFYCGTSMTIYGVLDSSESTNGITGLYNVLAAKQYGKVYIMFGINECGSDTDYFLKQYAKVLDVIRQYQPNALIYIQSVLYVSQTMEWNQPVFASSKLKEMNAGLMEFANGEDIFYLEVNDVLNDGTDHLPSDYTGDGAHLKANKYYLWRDYLYEHAIVDAEHPYPL